MVDIDLRWRASKIVTEMEFSKEARFLESIQSCVYDGCLLFVIGYIISWIQC